MSNRASLASSLSSSFKSVSLKSPAQQSKSHRPNSCLDVDEDGELGPIYFVELPSQALICKCCEQVFRCPVVLNCGHTACKQCSHQYASCPLCGNEDMRMVIENLALKEQIDQLEIYCDFGIDQNGQQDPAGCPSVIKLGERRAHREQCEYAPVPCPNSPGCAHMKRSELATHLERCNQARCKHHAAGCTKIGDKIEMSAHEDQCVFALMGGALASAIDQRIVAERDEMAQHPIIRRFDDRLQVLTMDVENVQGQMLETKRVHDEIADLRRDIALLSNQVRET